MIEFGSLSKLFLRLEMAEKIFWHISSEAEIKRSTVLFVNIMKFEAL